MPLLMPVVLVVTERLHSLNIRRSRVGMVKRKFKKDGMVNSGRIDGLVGYYRWI